MRWLFLVVTLDGRSVEWFVPSIPSAEVIQAWLALVDLGFIACCGVHEVAA